MHHTARGENGQLLGQLFTCFCTQCVAQLNSAAASGLSLSHSLSLSLSFSLSLYILSVFSCFVFSLLIVHSKSTCCRRSCVCPMFVWCLFENSTGQGRDRGGEGVFPLLLALLISCSICCHCWAGEEGHMLTLLSMFRFCHEALASARLIGGIMALNPLYRRHATNCCTLSSVHCPLSVGLMSVVAHCINKLSALWKSVRSLFARTYLCVLYTPMFSIECH